MVLILVGNVLKRLEHFSIYHVWWTCDKSKSYWYIVKNFLTKTFGQQINNDNYVFLLTIVDSETPSSLKYVIMHITVATRLPCPEVEITKNSL